MLQSALEPAFRGLFLSFPLLHSIVIPNPGRFLGYVRVWKDGDDWRWCPVGAWAPEDAELGDRYRDPDGEDVIHLKRGDAVEYIRGAVKTE
jgi:hypothetical protein